MTKRAKLYKMLLYVFNVFIKFMALVNCQEDIHLYICKNSVLWVIHSMTLHF